MNRFASLLLALVAIINLLPVVGVLSAARLESLYAIPIAELNLEIAMRHRAITIALVGVLVALSIFRPELRPAAYGVAAVSMGSFVLLVLAVGGANAALVRVFWIDVVALGLLGVAWWVDRVGAGAA